MISDRQLTDKAQETATNLGRWLDAKETPTFTPHRLPEYFGPDWPQHGLCRDAPGDWVDLVEHRKTNSQTIRKRKTYELEMCAACPVKIPCLDFALTTGQREGIWGGTLPSDRK